MITVEFLDEEMTVASIRRPWRWWERLFGLDDGCETAVVAVAALYGGLAWIYDDTNKPVTDQRVLDAIDRQRRYQFEDRRFAYLRQMFAIEPTGD